MCVTSEEPDAPAGYPGITVYAPRLSGIDGDLLGSVDWGEVLKHGSIGSLAGLKGGWAVGAVGATIGAVGSIESQIDIEDVIELTYDLPVIPGYPLPNTPLY